MTEPAESTQIGRYVLAREIAAGGMATVHLGRLVGSAGFSRVVAIKRLHAQYAKDPAFATMFVDEARLVARIRHPNVVPTLDVVSTESELFLVMEYVEGEALSKLIRACAQRDEPPEAALLASIMTGVLRGLHAAHEAKAESGEPLDIIHRDVSPQNIIIGIDGVPRVVDFGVAKAASRTQSTSDGILKGKISYMAPEQVQYQDVDARVDIYAATVVFWEALTGKRMFTGDNPMQVAARVIDEVVPPPSTFNQNVTPELDDIVTKGLAKSPDDRFASALEMVEALEESFPIVSQSRIGKWVKRLADDALMERARHVAEIESVKTPAVAMPGPDGRLGSMPDIAELPAGPTELYTELTAVDDSAATRAISAESASSSQLSSISVATSRAQRAKPRGATVGVLIGIAGFTVFAAFLVIVLVAREMSDRSDAAEAASTAPLASQTAPVASGEQEPSSPAALEEPAASSDPAPSEDAGVSEEPTEPPAEAAPAVPEKAPPAPAPRGPTKPWAPKPTKAKSCNPPYYIDARGVKKFKVHCL